KSENNSTWTTVETGLTSDGNGAFSPTNPLGVNTYYRFTETEAPSGYILDNDNKTTTFYINADGYICDPKSKAVLDSENPYQITITNTKPAIEKFIDKSKGDNTDLVKSSSVVYTEDEKNTYYTFKVTTPNVDMSKLKTFKITDTVNRSNGGTPKMYKVTKEDGTELSSSAYTFTATYHSSPSPQNLMYDVVIDFDTTKLDKNTDYYVTICAVLQFSGSNTAQLVYSTKTNDTTSTNTIDSDTVNFLFFGYRFKKAIGGTSTGLAGVEFQIFESEEDAIARRNPVVGTTDSSSRTTTDTFVSDKDGIVKIAYLDVGDTEDSERDYWIVETKTVSGYNLLNAPFKVTVSKDTFDTDQKIIYNSKKFTLPLTGGAGFMLFIGLGIASIGTGVILLLSSKKKKNINKA
ncbi:MAG: SpaH/EbpB family LPXTG-anchored major pilin, partial [Ruminococcus sp.]|nr:SpaH/EbpB family LPXTG-anchored major pilin [Ruminococcus sp.]